MKSLNLSVSAACLAVLLASTPVYAAEKAKGMPDEAAMKKMMEMSAPGEKHKVLDALVGEWDYTVTYRMAADAPEQKSTGTSENQWVLDGRYVQQKATGEVDMNQDGKMEKYEGMGLIGHDNVKGEYKSLWADNMSTGMMIASGKYDTSTKTLNENGQFSCPMKGGDVKVKSEWRFVDKDTMTYTVHDVSAKKPFKSMEIAYKRK